MRTLSEHFNRAARIDRASNLSTEEILGPNWQTLFDFWIYIDSLDYEEIAQICQSFVEKYGPGYYDDNTRIVPRDIPNGLICDGILWGTMSDFIKERYEGNSLDDGHSWYKFLLASREIVKMHKIIESGESLKYLPLCVVS